MTVGADQISLKLRVKNARVEGVTIEPDRTTMAARILEGKTPQEACRLLPLLFSLCSTAQLQAGLRGFEQSLGYVPSHAHQTARQILLICEGISEHCTRILVDWAGLACIDNDMANLRDLRSLLMSIHKTLFANKENDCISGGPLCVDHAALDLALKTITQNVEKLIFGERVSSFLSRCSSEDFLDWMSTQNTVPAQCLLKWYKAGVLQGDWPQINLLPSPSDEYVAEQMDMEDAEEFIARPTYKEKTAETGPFVRQIEEDLIKDMVNQYGFGPFSRFAAKLVDLAKMTNEMPNLVSGLDQDQSLFHTKALHQGVGRVEAVRGLLCHRVHLDPETDIIKSYRILAPTEWNFHPMGPLKTALIGIEAKDCSKLEQIAHLAILALDPCVASNIVIEEA